MNDDIKRYFHTMGANGCGYATACSILRNARTLQRLAAEACNRPLTTREEKRIATCEANVHALVMTLGAVASIGGDPRGYVVKLVLPRGEHNT